MIFESYTCTRCRCGVIEDAVPEMLQDQLLMEDVVVDDHVTRGVAFERHQVFRFHLGSKYVEVAYLIPRWRPPLPRGENRSIE